MKNTNNTIGRIIPLTDLSSQYNQIKEDIDLVIKNVLSSNSYILGPEVENFEKELAAYIGVNYSVGVASGTDAITIALKALGIKEGDGVVVPANVYPTSFGAALSGASLQLADVDPDSLNITLESIQRVVTNATKAIIVVHLYGNPVDISPIQEYAQQNNIFLIEDCAQAFGAVYKNKKVGSFGDINCFSFYPTKNLGAYGDGGAITTNNKNYAEKVKSLRMYGEHKRYDSTVVGYNSRLDEIQAGILRVKLRCVNDWNNKRKELAFRYREYLKNIPIKMLKENREGESAHHLFVVLVEDRLGLVTFLGSQGITTGIHYPTPIHLVDAFSYLGYKSGNFPVSEEASKKVLSLPFYPDMSFSNVDFVVESIKKFYQ